MSLDEFHLDNFQTESFFRNRLEDWKSRLIDLSKRNRLLYFKPTKRSYLSISNPDMVTTFNKLLLRKKKLEFWTPPDASESIEDELYSKKDLFPFTADIKPKKTQIVCNITNRKDLERTLKNLSRRSRSDYRERGVRVLYVTFGMLVWKETTSPEEVRSPVLLVPIILSRESVRDPFTISVPPVEEEVLLNPALQVKMENDLKVNFPPLPDFLLKNSLENYFNSVEEIVNNLGWKIERTVEIGIFSYHKLVIYKDLKSNEDAISKHPLIHAVTDNKKTNLLTDSLPYEKDIDNIEDPKQIFQVLDADSSQRVAIRYALNGQSFVMQGPPGTGKSQTITNIISECIAQGKSVLFVSDKMAALEIVYKRLRAVGLSHFCLELHSNKANKREVVAELKKSLDEQLIPKKIPSLEEFERLKNQRKKLNEYVALIHKKHVKLEITPYDVLGYLSTLEKVPFIPVKLSDIQNLNPLRLSTLLELMTKLKSVWQVIDEPSFPWYSFLGTTFDMEICSELSTSLENLMIHINLLQSKIIQFSKKLGLSPLFTFNQVEWLIKIGEILKESPKPEINWVLNPKLDLAINEAENFQKLKLWCKKTRDILLEKYHQSIFNIDPIRSLEITKILSELPEFLKEINFEESQLLRKQEELLAFAKSTRKEIEQWISNSNELSKIFDLNNKYYSIRQVTQLVEISNLCFSNFKPESHWFDPLNLPNKHPKYQEIKTNYIEYVSLTNRINKLYAEKIYEIDVEDYIRLYSGPYSNFLRWFRPKYYKDQKSFALLSLDGKTPASILDDLRAIRRIRYLKSKIESSKELTKRIVGHFYQENSTNFLHIEKAIEVVLKIFALLGTTKVPDSIINLIAFQSDPPQKIKQIGLKLQESIKTWNDSLKNLISLVPENCFLKSNLSIYETNLSKLNQWALELENKIYTLCILTDEPIKMRKIKKPKNYTELLGELKRAELVRKKEQEVKNDHYILKPKFGFRFLGLNSNWNEIISLLKWTKKIQELFNHVSIPKEFAQRLFKGPTYALSTVDISTYSDATLRFLAKFESRFEEKLVYKAKPLCELDLKTLYCRIKEIQDRVDDLQLWVDFKKIRNSFSKAGLSSFFSLLVENRPSTSQLIDVFKRGVYQEWIDWLYSENPKLGNFRRENHEQLITDFKKLDRKLIHLSSNRVIAEANSRKPQDIIIKAVDSEVNTLLKEAAKKRRLMPIRNLLKKIPNLLFKLKPCLLMSPISVSQFLDSDLMKFDLVLFDEASQIVPEDAIGSIYRGKTVVVAGDNKQLPPTSFFQKSLIEDYDWDEVTEGEVEVFDSILDEFLGIGLPVKTLRWHYRSKHEELISFSNSQFYDDSLITFPSALAKDDNLGVKFHFVNNGIYDRGGSRTNITEAESIADLVFEHFFNNSTKTLGVVTFSIAQMEAIEEAIERRLNKKPELEHFFKEDRLEGFFVKNLENVQGDERDVMIFSVGYGRDYKDRLTMNFGPLNKPGGERRLNVAVTRAREKIVLVASIRANDIRLSDNSPQGVVTLYQYLKYAERGPKSLGINFSRLDGFDSKIEKAVASDIQNMGYQVTPKVGFSGYRIDLGVVDPTNPENFILGVECDGNTYRSSYSARDRDRLREQVLNQLGWQIHRVWSPTWVSRRDSEVKRLKELLRKRLEHKLRSNAISKNLRSEESSDCFPKKVEIKKINFSGIEKIGVPYEIHPLNATIKPTVTVRISTYPYSSIQKNDFHFECNRDLQSRLLEELVNNEGPIHFDYAVKRLAAVWNVRRAGHRIVSAAREALELLLDDEKIIIKENFLWPNKQTKIKVRVPIQGIPETKRIPEHIPFEEISKAIKLVVQYAIGISPESLMIETAKLFGFNPKTETIRKKISKVYEELLKSEVLYYKDDIVTLSHK
jgi:superfamily I DNA and/or RNA helicase/very-short-patch-repair endonuclease